MDTDLKKVEMPSSTILNITKRGAMPEDKFEGWAEFIFVFICVHLWFNCIFPGQSLGFLHC